MQGQQHGTVAKRVEAPLIVCITWWLHGGALTSLVAAACADLSKGNSSGSVTRSMVAINPVAIGGYVNVLIG